MSSFFTNIKRDSSFSRTVSNEAKMGAYYTDPEHCRAIGRYLQFPDEGEVMALEPSIGDANAIILTTGKKEGDNIHIFGVELNEETYAKTKQNSLVEEVLKADYLRGIQVTPSSFSFCFSNPPYGVDIDGMRLEKLFLERIANQLCVESVLCFVVPENVFKEPSFFVFLYNRFELKHVLKFHEKEYEKWHQVVIIGKKRKSRINILKEQRAKLIEEYADIPEIDFDYNGEKVGVSSIDPGVLRTFTTTQFPAKECAEALLRDNDGVAASFYQAMAAKVCMPPFTEGVERPPVKLSRDSTYLLAICGVGQGESGDEDDGDAHLQRGTVKMVELLGENEKEGKEDKVITGTTRALVTYKVIEADGTVSELI